MTPLAELQAVATAELHDDCAVRLAEELARRQQMRKKLGAVATTRAPKNQIQRLARYALTTFFHNQIHHLDLRVAHYEHLRSELAERLASLRKEGK